MSEGLFSHVAAHLCLVEYSVFGLNNIYSFLCPQLQRSWWGILVSGCPCIRLWWRTVHARVLKFHIWIPRGKIADTHFFFLSELSPFMELCPFEKIRMKSDACHIFWAVHARVLEISYMDSSWKNNWPVFFFLVRVISLSGVIPLWKNQNKKTITLFFQSYGPLKIWAFWKNQNEIFSARYLKVFELGAWNLVSW